MAALELGPPPVLYAETGEKTGGVVKMNLKMSYIDRTAPAPHRASCTTFLHSIQFFRPAAVDRDYRY